MHRNDGPNAATDIGNGERGFEDQNLPGVVGSTLISNFMNAVQEEIAEVITQAGLTLRASGADDKAAGWGQLYPAVSIIIQDALNGLISSNVQNTSTVPGATVTDALDDLLGSTQVNATDISNHLATTLAHLASSILNDSGVTGAKVSDALDALLVGINTHTTQIGNNATLIANNTAAIAVNAAGVANNTAAIAALPKFRVWNTDMNALGFNLGISANSSNEETTNVGTTPGWNDLTANHMIEIIKRGSHWRLSEDPQKSGIVLNAQYQSANEISVQAMNPATATFSPSSSMQVQIRAWDPA